MLSAITLPNLDGVVVFSARHLSSSKSLHPTMIILCLVRYNGRVGPGFLGHETYKLKEMQVKFDPLSACLCSFCWWGFKREQDMRLHPRRSQAILVVVNPNVSPGKGNSNKEVIMVDPLEAKRLALKQMAQMKAKERLGKRRKIEAINGAWAMIGLTAGLVIDGGTGKSITAQLVGYWAAFIGLFVR